MMGGRTPIIRHTHHERLGPPPPCKRNARNHGTLAGPAARKPAHALRGLDNRRGTRPAPGSRRRRPDRLPGRTGSDTAALAPPRQSAAASGVRSRKFGRGAASLLPLDGGCARRAAGRPPDPLVAGARPTPNRSGRSVRPTRTALSDHLGLILACGSRMA
jgi:hypothetical protein